MLFWHFCLRQEAAAKKEIKLKLTQKQCRKGGERINTRICTKRKLHKLKKCFLAEQSTEIDLIGKAKQRNRQVQRPEETPQALVLTFDVKSDCLRHSFRCASRLF